MCGSVCSLNKSRSSTPHSEKTDDGVLDLHMRPTAAAALGRPPSSAASRLDSTLDRLKKRTVSRRGWCGRSGVSASSAQQAAGLFSRPDGSRRRAGLGVGDDDSGVYWCNGASAVTVDPAHTVMNSGFPAGYWISLCMSSAIVWCWGVGGFGPVVSVSAID